jgi:hypothetical protein
MDTFWQWSRLRGFLEAAWYTFDAKQYNDLFNDELEKVIAKVGDPQALQALRGFNWLSYITASVWHAGYRDQRERDEKTHEVVVKLLTGKLFRGYDPRLHGPMDLRFRRSVGNAIRNMVELERNRKRLLPSISIGQEFEPGGVTADELPNRMPADDEKVIDDFRRLVKKRLGELGVAVLDVRLGGGETKSLVGSPSLGSPGKWTIKRVVWGIKQLAREFATSLGDSEMLRWIEKAMAAEEETVAKRRATTMARAGA